MSAHQLDDAKTATVAGAHGRDIGKTFTILEVGPLDMSGFVLRLVAALRVESYTGLLEQLNSVKDGAPLDAIMQVLRGSDPQAVHALVREALDYVHITPDPKHPGVLRPLLANDVRELKTLGEILMAFAKLNLGT
ncbi:tail assembly chaperone [Ralstonia phage PQ43W]